MSAPRYSFGKPANGRRNAAKIHIDEVREIRRWAVREGWGMTVEAQARVQQLRYPLLSRRALENILDNSTWYDPTYDRHTPDPEWLQLPTAWVLILLIRQMYTLVQSSLHIEDREEPRLSQRGDAVLDGAAIEAGGIGQHLRGGDLGLLQRNEHVARG